MASSVESVSSSQPAPIFRGSYVPEHPVTIDEVIKDSFDELLHTLDRLDSLWIEYGNSSSIINALRAQEQLDTNFEIGLGWMIQRAIFRADFDGTSEEFQQHLDADKALHSAVAEICASEAMSSISQKFTDAISNLNQSIEETETLDLELFKFAGPAESEETDFQLDFVRKAIGWVESHGENALENPRLSTIENVRVKFWDLFKIEDDNQDKCVGDEHRLGTNLWNCPTCVVYVTLQKLAIPGPSSGRLSRVSADQVMTDAHEDEEETSDEESAFSPAITLAVAAPVANNQPNSAVATLPPVAVTAAAANPFSQAQTLPAIQLAPAVAAPAPAGGLFKPVYVQIKANGHNGLVPVQAPMAVAAILARSANLPDAQKESRLTQVGGVRYLCAYGPAGSKCPKYFQCRPDLAKHGREDHGVNPFPAADWAEMGPYNVDEMRILRPGHPFILKSARDSAHMR